MSRKAPLFQAALKTSPTSWIHTVPMTKEDVLLYVAELIINGALETCIEVTIKREGT